MKYTETAYQRIVHTHIHEHKTVYIIVRVCSAHSAARASAKLLVEIIDFYFRSLAAKSACHTMLSYDMYELKNELAMFDVGILCTIGHVQFDVAGCQSLCRRPLLVGIICQPQGNRRHTVYDDE